MEAKNSTLDIFSKLSGNVAQVMIEDFQMIHELFEMEEITEMFLTLYIHSYSSLFTDVCSSVIEHGFKSDNAFDLLGYIDLGMDFQNQIQSMINHNTSIYCTQTRGDLKGRKSSQFDPKFHIEGVENFISSSLKSLSTELSFGATEICNSLFSKTISFDNFVRVNDDYFLLKDVMETMNRVQHVITVFTKHNLHGK